MWADDTALQLLQRRGQQLSWEQSVLKAWAQEPGCTSQVLDGCGVEAVVVQLEEGEVRSQIYTQGVGGPPTFEPRKMSSIFPIASNTKILTSILLVALSDLGHVSMGDTVQGFLGTTCGGLPGPVANITLLELASQTSGLPAQPTNRHMEDCQRDPIDCNPFTKYAPQDLCETLKQVRLGPKGHYLYSNLAFGMLGYLLELRMATPYEQLTQRYVLQPLEMYSARVTLNASEWQALAPMGRDAVTGQGRWRRQPYGILQGNGAFLASVPDMGRLVAAMLKASRGEDTKLVATLRQTLRPATRMLYTF